MSNSLTSLLQKTQNAETTHLDEQQRTGRSTLQWFLEKDVETHPIHNHNELKFFICSEGFDALERDIRQATSTIDLVCWGFDPAMELTRMIPTSDPAVDGYKTWPRGAPYGDLLAEKAAQGVQVRLLLWYDSAFLEAIKGSPLAAIYAPAFLVYAARGGLGNIVNRAAENAPDLPLVWQPMPGFSTQYQRAPRIQARNVKPTSAEVRSAYARAWWHAALSGRIDNLEVRFRRGDTNAVKALKAVYLPAAMDFAEEVVSFRLAPTHHQKPVLIDYHAGQGGDPKALPHTCGYVMGLNSTTAYWDSPAHLYNDPRREAAFGGGLSRNSPWERHPWHVKPYRDYAIRVRGEALACLNRNFAKAWDRAQTTKLAWPSASLEKARAAVRPPRVGAHRAQIVRTQPEEDDATILKSYVQACSNACSYIYVENQYFQLADWVQFVKQMRQRTLDMLHANCRRTDQLPPLHLILVTPQAERDEMVPRTYDALAQMGEATSVRGYHRQVEEVQMGRPVLDNHGEVVKGRHLEMLRRSAQISQSAVRRELDRLNIKTVAAMLMTYDHDNEAQHLKIRKRDNTAQEAQADQERAESKRRQPRAARPAARDEIEGDYSEANIRPRRYREIYIHSKLLLIDDSFISLGSANLNIRSMVVDSEINITIAERELASQARRRVWANLAGADLDGGDGRLGTMANTIDRWKKRAKVNADKRFRGLVANPPENGSFIHTHDDVRDAPLLRLA